MENKLFVHIGPPKTATTFIQKVLFPKIESLNCFVKPNISIGGNSLRFGDLFNLTPSVWGEVSSELFEEANKKKRNIIVSDEIIFDGFAAPLPWIPKPGSEREMPARPRRHTHARPDPYLVARHFQNLREKAIGWGYSGVKFLMTTRRQDAKLASDYAQISDRVRGAGQESFERWVRYLINDVIGYNKGGGVKLDYFLWHEVMSDAIGIDNTFFIPFEFLKEDKSCFVREVLNYIGVEKVDKITKEVSSVEGRNVRSRSSNEWDIRAPARYGPNLRPTRLFESMGLPTSVPLRYPDFSRDEKIKLTRKLRKDILGVYQKGNENLEKCIEEHKIKNYGYY